METSYCFVCNCGPPKIIIQIISSTNYEEKLADGSHSMICQSCFDFSSEKYFDFWPATKKIFEIVNYVNSVEECNDSKNEYRKTLVYIIKDHDKDDT